MFALSFETHANNETHRAQFSSAADAFAYITAGNATLTAVSKVSGARYTYKVARAKHARPGTVAPLFVSVLIGNGDYVYIGTIFEEEKFVATRKSAHREGSKPWDAFSYAWHWLRNRGVIPQSLELWHEGRCGRCGRSLTVPASIISGLGPVCASKAN